MIIVNSVGRIRYSACEYLAFIYLALPIGLGFTGSMIAGSYKGTDPRNVTFLHTNFLGEKPPSVNKKTALLGRFFCLHLAVPTGFETVKCNYFPTDFELNFMSFQEFFFCKDWLILLLDCKGCQAIYGGFVKSRDNCPLISTKGDTLLRQARRMS